MMVAIHCDLIMFQTSLIQFRKPPALLVSTHKALPFLHFTLPRIGRVTGDPRSADRRGEGWRGALALPASICWTQIDVDPPTSTEFVTNSIASGLMANAT